MIYYVVDLNKVKESRPNYLEINLNLFIYMILYFAHNHEERVRKGLALTSVF